MSQTALLDAIRTLDVARVQELLTANPRLRALRNGKGLNLLQMCSARPTAGDRAAASRQLRLARWLVASGFDPRAVYQTAPGEDGERDPATVSLAWFAVAKAQNNQLARYFLEQGAAPGALFAAAWWGNAEIISELVTHGANLNEVVGATPLHLAVTVAARGIEGAPELARRRRRVIDEMLRLGADPDIAAEDGTTPLRTALDRGFFAVYKALVTHGASPDLPGKDGRSVRDVAARKHDKRFIHALRADESRRSARRPPL